MTQEIEKEPTPTKALVPNEQIVKQENEIVNDYDIDGFLQKRKEFIAKVNKIMVEKKDYYVIQGKKSLAKGGAEKIASIFGWSATFKKDQDVVESFKGIEGLVSFICNLTKNSVSIGEGRGAAILGRNAGDPNKTIKMAQKSAFIDAVLRASGLSDFFTQDLEDMPEMREAPFKSQNIASDKVIDLSEQFNEAADLVGVSNYERFAQKIVDSKDLKELEAWGNNIKFAGKTLSVRDKANLRVVYKKRKDEIIKELT